MGGRRPCPFVRGAAADDLRMRPELGPPDTEHVSYPERDESWEREWHHFAETIRL